MISFVAGVFFDRDVGSVELAVEDLSCGESVGRSATWNFVFHETVISFNVDFRLFVTPNVNVCYWVSFGKLLERSKWVDS